MEILCSDKTGTLTKNELTVASPIAYVGEVPDVIFDAALASKPENGDAIDIGMFSWGSPPTYSNIYVSYTLAAMVGACSDEQREYLANFQVLQFTPFDPVGKKTSAKIRSSSGEVFHTAKGEVLSGGRFGNNSHLISSNFLKAPLK